jgi:ornithine cyclodeaminase/alanine dehydrogenase-like protein (mu-crystallin family)
MSSPRVLVLSRRDVAALLGISECIDAVAEAFRRQAEGRALPPLVVLAGALIGLATRAPAG